MRSVKIPKKQKNISPYDVCGNCGHNRANHKRVCKEYECQYVLDYKEGISGRLIPTGVCGCKKFVKEGGKKLK